MSESPKIVPIRQAFENMQALLARIAEDPEAAGFCGVVILGEADSSERSLVSVSFDASRAEMAFAGAILTQQALDGEDSEF